MDIPKFHILRSHYCPTQPKNISNLLNRRSNVAINFRKAMNVHIVEINKQTWIVRDTTDPK